jgi:hypothetical protein
LESGGCVTTSASPLQRFKTISTLTCLRKIKYNCCQPVQGLQAFVMRYFSRIRPECANQAAKTRAFSIFGCSTGWLSWYGKVNEWLVSCVRRLCMYTCWDMGSQVSASHMCHVVCSSSLEYCYRLPANANCGWPLMPGEHNQPPNITHCFG